LNEAQEHINGEAEDKVSAREIECFKDIIRDVVDFLNDNCLLDEDGMIDREGLDDVCQAMAKAGIYAEEEEED
jgi:ribosomal protein S15P/S13E